MPSPLDLLDRLLRRDGRPQLHALRARYFKNVFSGESGEFVAGDLARFCFAYDTTVVSGDPIEMALHEGRRQVLLRIQSYSGLGAAEIMGFAARAQGLEADVLKGEISGW